METNYAKWVQQEKQWMGIYRKKVLKKVVCVVLPLTAVIMGILFGGMTLINGDPLQEAAEVFAGGMILGIFIICCYILILLPGLSGGRMSGGINKAVKSMNLNDAEKEQLGREMLDAAGKADLQMDFEMVGPKTNHTPASVIVTENYAYMRGGSPLVNLVRFADVEHIESSEESHTATQRGAQTKTTYHFTLHCIGFYFRNRVERGTADSDLPDQAMGFFSEEIRDKAYQMIQKKFNSRQ